MIYVVTPTATSSQIFLDEKQGIQQPCALLVTGKKSKKKMFITMEDSDYIKVFKISGAQS